MNATAAQKPKIVAHRGASHEAPENTIPAFELAWSQGADAIEGDFHLTADRQIVCIHDPNTLASTGRKRTVRKTSLAALRFLDASRGQPDAFPHCHIPTLAEFLATVPRGKSCYLELKSSPRILRTLFKELDRATIDPAQIAIIAFSPRLIAQLKRLRPSLTAYLLRDYRQLLSPKDKMPDMDSLLATLRHTRADGLSVENHPAFTRQMAEAILAAGFSLHVWTVDSLADAERWTDLGVSSITTNRPSLLLEGRSEDLSQ